MNSPIDTSIAWDIDIPLVTNPRLLGAVAKVTLGSAGLVAALVSLPLAVQGAWDAIPALVGMFAAAGAAFLLLSLLIMWAMFGNRFKAHFVVDADGVRHETRDRVAKASHRAALVVGVLLGRPGAAGAGWLAVSRERQALRWGGAFRAEVDARRRTIALRNGWRTLMLLYCTPQNFEAVRALVLAHLAAHHAADPAPGRSPLAACLGRTAMAVLACLPMFLLASVYRYGLLLPLLLMCFAIGTVWFVRHLAWVVLVSAAWLVAAVLMDGLGLRSSPFSVGTRYRRCEVLSGDDWVLTVLAALGLAWLVWQAVQTLRRRIVPALESDRMDGQG